VNGGDNFMSRASILYTALAVVVMLSASTGHASSQLKWLKGNKPKFIAFSNPAYPFVVEYPDNWRVSHGGAGSATFTQSKNEAAVIVDRQLLEDRPLTPNDVGDLFRDSEVDRIKQNYSQATGIRPRVETLVERRIVIIDFNAPGLKPNETELVRQYTIPIGLNLFRVTCRARAQYFKNYEPTFEYMAASVQAAPAPGAARN